MRSTPLAALRRRLVRATAAGPSAPPAATPARGRAGLSSARPVALVPLLTAAVLGATLVGCANTELTRSPEERLADAIDRFQRDNTGFYDLTLDLGTSTIDEQGYYRVSPDASGTVRTVTGFNAVTGLVDARYLRLLNDVYLALPDTVTGDIRQACWAKGNIRSAARKAGLEAGDLPLVGAAVEVVLSLRGGEEQEDGTLLADANARAVASAFGYRTARDLRLPGRRVDVPVTVTLDDEGRIVGWSASLADVVAEAKNPDPAALVGASEFGEVSATFAEPGDDRDFSAPPSERTINAEANPKKIAALVEACPDIVPVIEDPASPTDEPTDGITDEPTDGLTDGLTDEPTDQPTDQPTEGLTGEPSLGAPEPDGADLP